MARSHSRCYRQCGAAGCHQISHQAGGGDGLSEAGQSVKHVLIAAALAACCAQPALAFDAKNIPAPKGEQVWFAEDHTLPMIAMVVAVPAGSGYDPVAKPGLASFAADLLDEGAGKLNSQAFHTALSNRAIRL